MAQAVAASSSADRGRSVVRSRFWTRIAILALAAGVLAVGVPLFFAGSADRLADGTKIAGIDVGGLTPKAAQTLLEQRSARLATVPVLFVAGNREFPITPRSMGVEVDWHAAVASAAREGGGGGVLRGYRRLELQLFPKDVAPPTRSYGAAVDYELGLLGHAVDTPHRQAALVRRGLHITIAPGKTGRVLDRPAARALLVDALASFSRTPVALPVRLDAPQVTVSTLTANQMRASQIISGPVTVVAGPTRLRVPRWRLAKLLDLQTMRFVGPAADAFFARLERTVDRPAKDASFAIHGSMISVLPAAAGLTLDVPRSVAAVLAAAERPANRVATLAFSVQQPARSTAAASAMGITGVVGSYETEYGGDPNRIHNVQLVARLVDDKLIAPGATFSFNGTTGERSVEKGFLEAPVIVNGELQTGVGGGVCQVSTTVFNAAYEAGLRITARTNHSLYISHYPLGRDATVNYPDTDLKFVNDTPHWLLLRTWVGPSSLTVVLYGSPQHRRIETTTAPLVVTSPAPVTKTVDATLKPGQVVVDDPGTPAQSTSVERKVYARNGKLLSDETWYSSYRSTPAIVRVGPKKQKPATTTTGTTTTTTTTTTTGTTTTGTTTPTAPSFPH
jgi:vancomycin resistance protein YoaR